MIANIAHKKRGIVTIMGKLMDKKCGLQVWKIENEFGNVKLYVLC